MDDGALQLRNLFASQPTSEGGCFGAFSAPIKPRRKARTRDALLAAHLQKGRRNAKMNAQRAGLTTTHKGAGGRSTGQVGHVQRLEFPQAQGRQGLTDASAWALSSDGCHHQQPKRTTTKQHFKSKGAKDRLGSKQQLTIASHSPTTLPSILPLPFLTNHPLCSGHGRSFSGPTAHTPRKALRALFVTPLSDRNLDAARHSKTKGRQGRPNAHIST